MNHFVNLLNGKISKKGTSFDVFSPIDQTVLGKGYQLSYEKIIGVFDKSFIQIKKTTKLEGLEKLGKYIEQEKKKFIEQITLETGYTWHDSRDIVNGAIELVNFFNKYIEDTSILLPESKFSYSTPIPRRLKIISYPYGIVAAMTPQNAPLILELTVILNSLAAGNSVVLRPSSQCVGTVSLLIEALIETFPSHLLQCISIFSCKATDFLDVSYKRANLIHYIGSSYYGKKILSDSLSHNIKALVDGEGNSTVVIDETASLDQAVKACRNGIIRCNGELCSTVRTIIVASKRFDKFCEHLTRELNKVKIGDPRSLVVDMGPLFHEKQAGILRNATKKYRLISGNINSSSQGKNYLTPLLCQIDSERVEFLNEEVFGPITGVVAYKGDDWKKWFIRSPYRLSDAVFSNDERFIKDFIAFSSSPRVVINHDPSIESVFEPWGAFLPSGQNDVSFWLNKYQKFIQVDTN